MSNRFFIIGAQRSATTFLYKTLEQHKGICLAQPVRPEPKYFLEKDFVHSKEFYETEFFKHADQNTLVYGEKSTSYIESEFAARKISEFYPDAKILIMLRDPLQRAISNYNFSVKNGIESLSFEEAILMEEERIEKFNGDGYSVCPFSYLTRGLYSKYIKVYEKYFSRDNILLIPTEKITCDLSYIKKVFDFINVEVERIPNVGVVNSAERFDLDLTDTALDFVSGFYDHSNAWLQSEFSFPIELWGRG